MYKYINKPCGTWNNILDKFTSGDILSITKGAFNVNIALQSYIGDCFYYSVQDYTIIGSNGNNSDINDNPITTLKILSNVDIFYIFQCHQALQPLFTYNEKFSVLSNIRYPGVDKQQFGYFYYVDNVNIINIIMNLEFNSISSSSSNYMIYSHQNRFIYC